MRLRQASGIRMTGLWWHAKRDWLWCKPEGRQARLRSPGDGLRHLASSTLLAKQHLLIIHCAMQYMQHFDRLAGEAVENQVIAVDHAPDAAAFVPGQQRIKPGIQG